MGEEGEGKKEEEMVKKEGAISHVNPGICRVSHYLLRDWIWPLQLGPLVQDIFSPLFLFL